MGNNSPIGIFDSGVGGISVLRWIRDTLPFEDVFYVSDGKYIPYGNKSQDFVTERSITLSRFLIERGAKAIVVACNTATAASIATLRELFEVPIIGVEPGVKPALSKTQSGVIGILATRETLCSRKFEDLIHRFQDQCTLILQACSGLVEQVERLDLTGDTTRNLVTRYVSVLLDKGADTIVLGCTHYSFLLPLIESAAGRKISIIDTGEAVAREVKRRLIESERMCDRNEKGQARFWTTGDLEKMQRLVTRFWDPAVRVMPLSVQENALPVENEDQIK